MKPPKLYLSLHHTDGQSYDDELDYEGYHRVLLTPSNWKTRPKEGYNTSYIYFGKVIKAGNNTAKFIGLGTGKVVLMFQRIGGYTPYDLAVNEGSEPHIKKKGFHIRPVG
jgi:hypothetical protein